MDARPDEPRATRPTPHELERARRSWILRVGVLGWGLGTALLWTLVMKLWMPATPLPAIALPALLLFPLGGWVWGCLTWRRLQAGRARGRDPRDE